jgi:hypothetical protein
MGIARFLPPRLTERGENLEQPPAIFGPDLFVDVPLVLGGEHLGIPKRDLPAGGKMQRVRPPIGRRTNRFYQIASFESVQQEHQPTSRGCSMPRRLATAIWVVPGFAPITVIIEYCTGRIFTVASGGADFHGQKRKNDTHASTSDPDSRLYRKAAGRKAKLCYTGHATMENRHGLVVAGMVTHANGTAERRASETMLKARRKAVGHRITAGEDKAYDTADHVANLRAINVTPHVTKNQAITKTGKTRNSAIDERTTRHNGYGMSQSRRAMIECIFGWGKQHGTMRKTKHRGIARVAADFLLNLIAYNLIRIPKLVAA